MRRLLLPLLLVLFSTPALSHAATDPAWTTPIAPFQIADNLYYVGSKDLASYLVVTPRGNILIDANLATSPPQIRASVEKLGFRWHDIKILLNSQAHFDHTAGAAEVIRETHAKNMAMEGDVRVMETGGRADFLAPSPISSPTHPSMSIASSMTETRSASAGSPSPRTKPPATPAAAPPGPCARIFPGTRRAPCVTS